MRLFRLLLHEAHYCLRDPRRFIFLFLASMIYMFIFGVLYDPGMVKSIPTVSFNEDGSRLGRHYLQQLEDNDSYGTIEYVASLEDLQQSLLNHRAYIGVMIPRRFAEDAKQGQQTSVLFLVDGQNLVTTSIAARDGETVTEKFSNRLAAKQLSLRLGVDETYLLHKIEPMHTTLRVLGNPTQDYSWFFLIGLATAAFQQGLFFAAAATLFQKETPAIELLPLGVRIAAKVLFVYLMALVSFGLMLTVMHEVLELPLKAGTFELFGIGAAFSLAVVGLGFLAAGLFPTELSFVCVSLIYPVMGFVLSGYTWPSLAMPRAIQLFADIFPQTWFMNTFRDLLLIGGTYQLQEHLLVLLLMGAVLLPAACWSACRRLRKIRRESSLA